MMEKEKWFRTRLWIMTGFMILAGGFLTGYGFQRFLDNRQKITEYQESHVLWKQKLAEGARQEVAWDLRNQELLENMKHVSMEQEIFFEDGSDTGEARISNESGSLFACTVTLIRDATGEVIYQSGLIEPGHYIEKIHLESKLQKGNYPCTAIWVFYAQDDEYIGETAWKTVVIVKN